MQGYRFGLSACALSLAVGLCMLGCMVGVGGAEPANPVISNVPPGTGLLGEGMEPPYLHGVQTNTETQSRAHEIRRPAPFGMRSHELGTEPDELGSSRLRELPAVDLSNAHGFVQHDTSTPTR